MKAELCFVSCSMSFVQVKFPVQQELKGILCLLTSDVLLKWKKGCGILSHQYRWTLMFWHWSYIMALIACTELVQ